MIVVNNIYKKFGKLIVLDGVSFSIEKGGVYAILGPNGSGKTTLLKTLLGMVIPNQGDIEVDGQSVLHEWNYRNQVGYLPQIAQFPDNLTVKELIRMIADLRTTPSNEQVLIDRFNVGKFMDKKLGELSGGTRQKVNIILTFMFDTPICVLDEPTAGLDPISMIELKKLIQEQKDQGKIILITTHIMSLVEELAEEIVFLLEGKIHFQGTLATLTESTKQDNLEHAIASMLTHA